jgi:hypothetical protein
MTKAAATTQATTASKKPATGLETIGLDQATLDLAIQRAVDARVYPVTQQFEEFRKAHEGHYGVRIAHAMGEDATKKLVTTMDTAKTLRDVEKAAYEAVEVLLKRMADSKKFGDEKTHAVLHLDKAAVIWGGSAALIVGAAGMAAVGYYAYDTGREQGQLDMIDAKVTLESHAASPRARR